MDRSTPSCDAHVATIDEQHYAVPPQNHRLRSFSSSGRGLFRRASKSIRSLVNRRPSAAAEDAAREGQIPDPRPATSHSLWNRSLGRSSRHLRTSRSFFGDIKQEPQESQQRHDGDYPSRSNQLEHGFTNMVLSPRTSLGPPIIPEHGGAAAKASAAMQNEYLARALQHALLRSPSAGDEEANDRESGIGIIVTDADAHTSQTELRKITRVDFISELPVELAIHILANLDAAGLAHVSRVSRNWNRISNNQHVWRDSCLREMTTTYATSSLVQPNRGLGIPKIDPSNDWKEIYRAKMQLSQRWREGQARPVYLNGHQDSIYCVQFDEYKIVTGSRDKTIRVWDLHTLECTLVIGPPSVIDSPTLLVNEECQPTHVATSSDGSILKTSTPPTVTFPIHHNASILCLQYDDRILVTGSSDGTCIIYDLKDCYRPIMQLKHHKAAVLDLAFDDKYIVTCSKDISICVWNRATGDLLKELKGHTGPVNAVQTRANTIVSCSGDHLVKLWNIESGLPIRELLGHTKGLACSQFSEDGRLVASAGNDQTIRIWDANTGELLRSMDDAHENLVRSLHVDSVSGRLVSASYDTDIKVWDMETGRQLLDFPHWHNSWVLSAKSDYRRIVSTGQEPKILVMDFGADVEGVDSLESEQTN